MPEVAIVSTSSETILERDSPLSQSIIWRLQTEFYEQRGTKAWSEDQVPCYITSNPFIAEIYARIVAGFLLDCSEHSLAVAAPLSSQNPLRIIELGAGPGKFAYLFLHHLSEILREKDLPLDVVRYCMTDCSASSLQSWRENSGLAKFVASGMLDFQLLKAGSRPVPAGGGGSLSRGPVVVIANYVFDSLAQDAFMVKGGQLSEFLVTTTAKAKPGESVTVTAEALTGLQFSYATTEVSPNRYEDSSWNEILQAYRSCLPNATVFFPTQSLKVVSELKELSDGRMLLLAADKGLPTHEALALVQGPPTLEFHASKCFSQAVNLHAIGRYFEADGGEALTPDKHLSNLSLCAFLKGREGECFSETAKAYRETQAAFGPDDLFALLSWLNAHMEEVTIPQALAILRMTRWDPVALMRSFPIIARQIGPASVERHDLRTAVLRTWENHYPLNPGDNAFAFQCGVILSALHFFDDAIAMYRRSQQIFGPSASTSYNLGLCEAALGRTSEALALMIEACELDPTFAPAQLSRSQMEQNAAQKAVP